MSCYRHKPPCVASRCVAFAIGAAQATGLGLVARPTVAGGLPAAHDQRLRLELPREVAALALAWSGELPAFAASEDIEEVMEVIPRGLWSGLSVHQNLRKPLRLPCFEVTPTRQALHDLALMRAQAITGFADGLFGSEEEMLLPQQAHEAVDVG